MTQETDKNNYGFPTSIEDYEWKETDRDAYEKTFVNMDRDTLYVEDTWQNQTTFDDLDGERYEVKLSRNYNAPDHPDKVVHTAMDWDETENFLEGVTQ